MFKIYRIEIFFILFNPAIPSIYCALELGVAGCVRACGLG